MAAGMSNAIVWADNGPNANLQAEHIVVILFTLFGHTMLQRVLLTRNFTSLNFISMFLAFLGYCEIAKAQTPCSIPDGSQIDIVISLIKIRDNKIILDDKMYLSINDVENNAVWTFTKQGHPAHPAIVCRYGVLASDGLWHTEIKAKCAGPKDACDALVHAFKTQ